MSWLFAALLVAAAVLLQRWAARRGTAFLQADQRPDTNLAEPGVPFRLITEVANTGRLPVPFVRVRQRLPEGILTADGSRDAEFTAWLLPGRRRRFTLQVTSDRRGRYLLPPLRLSSGDFLGLEEADDEVSAYREVVVLPREAPERALPEVLSGFLGQVSVRRWLYEDPVLTSGFHEYTGREPMRDISWPRTLRSGTMMVRTPDHTAEGSVTVLLDVPGTENEAMEACCRLARTVCRLLEERGWEYGFATDAVMAGLENSDAVLTPGLGQAHRETVLELLGRAQGYRRHSLAFVLDRIADGTGSMGCVLVSSDPAAGSDPAVRKWQNEGRTLLVLRPEEAEEC